MQRKKKRSIIFELHSIPIKFRKLSKRRSLCKRLYLVSYSIPLSCMVVLLLVMGMSIGTWSNYDIVKAEEGISTHIDVAHPTIAMDVSRNTSDGYGNDVAGQVTTAPGAGTAYRSHKVRVTGSDIQDYQLTISGPSELTPSSGASTVVSGAGGKTGEEMSNSNSNIWGYAWGEDKDEVTGMVYNTMTDTGSNLDCTSPSADYKVNCERKLVFGANFANNAMGGTYTAEVQLSLVATPHLVGQAWSNGVDTGIDDMQDIDKVDGGFCRADIPSGSTITLRDSRGGVENLYKIMKMPDGTCWMVENLRLGKDNTKVILTADDTDLNQGLTEWELPASYEREHPGQAWNDNGNNEAMIKTGTNMGSSYKEAYGNYYSWCAATAGSCLENEVAIQNKDASSSICPKGWKLPVGATGAGSFQSLYNSYPNNISNVHWLTNQIVPYNGGTSGASANGYNGKRFGNNVVDALFPAAGYVDSKGFGDASLLGYYWSRRAYADSDYAYAMGFDSGNVSPQLHYIRYRGYSVRCVADEGEGIWTKPDNTVFSTGLKTMQSITKENFSDKYCANTSVANALVPVGSTISLKDARDGNLYTIVKLKDGKCWMQQNLRLKLTGGEEIEGSKADGSAYNWTVPTNANNKNMSATTQAYSTSDTWTGDNTVVMSRAGSGTNGAYYTWCAATAGTCSGATSDGAVASASICPKGWHLPTGNTNGEFYNLTKGLNSSSITASPYLFPAAGNIGRNGSLYNGGYYWSSTASSSADAYFLYFYSSEFYPGTFTHDRFYGYSVRCIVN